MALSRACEMMMPFHMQRGSGWPRVRTCQLPGVDVDVDVDVEVDVDRSPYCSYKPEVGEGRPIHGPPSQPRLALKYGRPLASRATRFPFSLHNPQAAPASFAPHPLLGLSDLPPFRDCGYYCSCNFTIACNCNHFAKLRTPVAILTRLSCN